MKRILGALVILVLVVLAVANPLTAQAQTPKAGGTLKAVWDGPWTGLDPHVASTVSTARILDNVVESLTMFDDQIKLQPMLAMSWDSSADGKTWTFKLRQGVKFSNGREMTADDVVWSMNRILDPKTGSGRVTQVGGKGAKWAVVDKYTASVTTSTPNAILPNLLATEAEGIVAKESVGADGQIVVPIGTGPFTIAKVEGTTKITLAKNPNYWQTGKPYLDGVEITVISEDAPREAALVGNEADWLLTLAPQSVAALSGNKDLVVDKIQGLDYYYLGLNTKRPFLADKRVREAIAYSIDRQQLCDAGWFSLCTPVEGPTGPSSPWYVDYAPYKQDLAKAKQLLSEAGFPNGFSMELLPTSSYPDTVRQAQVLQQQLAAVNIQTTINSPEWTQWLDLEGNGKYDGYICSWNGLTDANDFYYLQHHTGEVFNFTGYSNPDFDKLVEQGRNVSDFDKRFAIYKQANQILVDDAPYVYFYDTLFIRAYRATVKGSVTRADGANYWTNTWLDK